MASPIRDGVILIVYLSLIIISYLVLSTPFEEMVAGFEGVSTSEVDSSVATARTVFNIIFAGLGIVPVFWFIVRTFMREPDWRQGGGYM